MGFAPLSPSYVFLHRALEVADADFLVVTKRQAALGAVLAKFTPNGREEGSYLGRLAIRRNERFGRFLWLG